MGLGGECATFCSECEAEGNSWVKNEQIPDLDGFSSDKGDQSELSVIVLYGA